MEDIDETLNLGAFFDLVAAANEQGLDVTLGKTYGVSTIKMSRRWSGDFSETLFEADKIKDIYDLMTIFDFLYQELSDEI